MSEGVSDKKLVADVKTKVQQLCDNVNLADRLGLVVSWQIHRSGEPGSTYQILGINITKLAVRGAGASSPDESKLEASIRAQVQEICDQMNVALSRGIFVTWKIERKVYAVTQMEVTRAF